MENNFLQDDFFDIFFPFRPSVSGIKPPVPHSSLMKTDIVEEDGFISYTIEIPGMKKDDISIDIDNDILTVSASSSASKEKKEGKKVYREERCTSFSRSFPLFEDLDGEKAEASYENGILTVKFGKKEGKKKKKIEIK